MQNRWSGLPEVEAVECGVQVCGVEWTQSRVWSGAERIAVERSGEEWRGVESSGEEWRGVERSGEERRGEEWRVKTKEWRMERRV